MSIADDLSTTLVFVTLTRLLRSIFVCLAYRIIDKLERNSTAWQNPVSLDNFSSNAGLQLKISSYHPKHRDKPNLFATLSQDISRFIRQFNISSDYENLSRTNVKSYSIPIPKRLSTSEYKT